MSDYNHKAKIRLEIEEISLNELNDVFGGDLDVSDAYDFSCDLQDKLNMEFHEIGNRYFIDIIKVFKRDDIHLEFKISVKEILETVKDFEEKYSLKCIDSYILAYVYYTGGDEPFVY